MTDVMTETCPRCKRIFQDACDEGIGSIVTDAFIDGRYIEMCPLCYAEDFKKMHCSKWLPLGEIASAMFEEAKRQYPKWRQ